VNHDAGNQDLPLRQLHVLPDPVAGLVPHVAGLDQVRLRIRLSDVGSVYLFTCTAARAVRQRAACKMTSPEVR
jgi:hypothetical protein